MSRFQLAQVNVGVIKGPMVAPVMAEFAASLDRINAVADGSPGFVWRLQTEEGDATSIRPFENENLLINMSVWRDLKSLNEYVYSSAHAQVMRRRREWFERMQEAYLALWWIPAGHRPTIPEAIAKLDGLRANGPTADVFNFRQVFPPPDAPNPRLSVSFGDECPTT
jgi:Domain of unknown function (DUF3291)